MFHTSNIRVEFGRTGRVLISLFRIGRLSIPQNISVIGLGGVRRSVQRIRTISGQSIDIWLFAQCTTCNKKGNLQGTKWFFTEQKYH